MPSRVSGIRWVLLLLVLAGVAGLIFYQRNHSRTPENIDTAVSHPVEPQKQAARTEVGLTTPNTSTQSKPTSIQANGVGTPKVIAGNPFVGTSPLSKEEVEKQRQRLLKDPILKPSDIKPRPTETEDSGAKHNLE